jgi:6-pyruvoyltetrahydropterin/6-carboxytetrahydropterin synthase
MKTVRIAKEFDFDAAHRLDRLPDTHKCHHLHGHTYRVVVECEGVPDELGFVCDYADIAEAWQPLHDALDHKYLNDIPGLKVPTTEVLAPWIFDHLKTSDIGHLLTRVRVYESSTTYCEYPA